MFKIESKKKRLRKILNFKPLGKIIVIIQKQVQEIVRLASIQFYDFHQKEWLFQSIWAAFKELIYWFLVYLTNISHLYYATCRAMVGWFVSGLQKTWKEVEFSGRNWIKDAKKLCRKSQSLVREFNPWPTNIGQQQQQLSTLHLSNGLLIQMLKVDATNTKHWYYYDDMLSANFITFKAWWTAWNSRVLSATKCDTLPISCFRLQKLQRGGNWKH
jgi:hypothetical protein